MCRLSSQRIIIKFYTILREVEYVFLTRTAACPGCGLELSSPEDGRLSAAQPGAAQVTTIDGQYKHAVRFVTSTSVQVPTPMTQEVRNARDIPIALVKPKANICAPLTKLHSDPAS